jgi:hypothetical protein
MAGLPAHRGVGNEGRSVIEQADLLLAHDWPYDAPFLHLLEGCFAALGLRLLCVGPERLPSTLAALLERRLIVRAFLDRASDTSPEFLPLAGWAQEAGIEAINPPQAQRTAWRKTNPHWRFLQAGVHVPYLIAIPAHQSHPILQIPHDLSALGLPFCVKPDVGGGGWGVRIDASTWSDVEAARRQLPEEDLILQQLVSPASFDGQRAWFRVLHSLTQPLPCWWDDQTRCYGAPVSEEDRVRWELDPLWRISEQAAEIGGLRLFSTEIACDTDHRFLVVDCINDPVDLRFQPHAREGMPAAAARRVAEALAAHVDSLPATAFPP